VTVTYTVVLEEEGGQWGGLVPDLPGLLLLGDTRDELLANAPAAILDYVDAMREEGLPIGRPGERVAQVQVPDLE
jgi:predicted RNase H-like HicB family nuclease